MKTNITIQGVSFTCAAASNIEETGCDVEGDLYELRTGKTTRERLLAACLDGADTDHVQGWRDYVAAIVAFARIEYLVRLVHSMPSSVELFDTVSNTESVHASEAEAIARAEASPAPGALWTWVVARAWDGARANERVVWSSRGAADVGLCSYGGKSLAQAQS